MKLVTFIGDRGPTLGVLLGGEVLDLATAAALLGEKDFPNTMQALIESGDRGLARTRALLEAPPSEAFVQEMPRLLAPLPHPIRVRDCSMFLEHMEVALDKMALALAESDPDPPSALAKLRDSGRYTLHPVFREQIIYYNADHLHIVGPDCDIAWPPHSTWADYELEWACVLGRKGMDIQPDRARDHIFGFTIFNDWSARDLQIPFMQANLGPGEGKDFCNAFGPCIATLDEFTDPYRLRMTATVNGERWSTGSTASMYHHYEEAIVQFSHGKPLFAGEVIASGTVLGGCGFELGRRLKHGDVVELEVEGIGSLRNRVLMSDSHPAPHSR
jgi:2-keto-4-pentenoate hydratase/2-oxohepta-3-ene-1,7-dioic acid hydratase in catechol pathway